MGNEMQRQKPTDRGSQGGIFTSGGGRIRRVAGALVFVLFAGACAQEPEVSPPEEEQKQLWDGLAASPAGEPEPEFVPLEIPDEAPLVAFLGDSISAGLHLPEDEAFPAVLQRTLLERGLPFRLINAGVSGDSTSGGLARTDWVLSQAPDILVVELGGNDGMLGISLETMSANLHGIIGKARAANCPVLLLGVRVPPSIGVEYSEQVAELYPDLAEQYDLAFVPFFMEGVGGVKEFTLPDGIHPNARGQQRLAQNVEAALETMLRAE